MTESKQTKFIRFFYNKDSELIKQFPNLSVRQQEAAVLAGYDLVADKEELDKMFSLKDEMFVDKVLEHIIGQNDLIWSMIISNEATFYEYQKTLINGVSQFKNDKDKLGAISIKTKLMEDSDAIVKRLETYYSKLFGDPKLLEKAKTKNYTPEGQANR